MPAPAFNPYNRNINNAQRCNKATAQRYKGTTMSEDVLNLKAMAGLAAKVDEGSDKAVKARSEYFDAGSEYDFDAIVTRAELCASENPDKEGEPYVIFEVEPVEGSVVKAHVGYDGRTALTRYLAFGKSEPKFRAQFARRDALVAAAALNGMTVKQLQDERAEAQEELTGEAPDRLVETLATLKVLKKYLNDNTENIIGQRIHVQTDEGKVSRKTGETYYNPHFYLVDTEETKAAE